MKKTEGEESKENKKKGLFMYSVQDTRWELKVSNTSQTLQA